MVSRDEQIMAFLSDGPKHFSDIEMELVKSRKEMAKQTLVTHLKQLVEDGKILKNRIEANTIYSLVPEYLSSAKNQKEITTLELLSKELELKTRKKLTLDETKPSTDLKGKDIDKILESLGPTKNKPELNFSLYMDKNVKEAIDSFKSTSEFSFEFEKLISKKLSEIKEKIPATKDDDFNFLKAKSRDWNEIRRFSINAANKHGFRLLLFSWYDGEEYKQQILQNIKKMDELQRTHQNDVNFLDEINRRCYYAFREYYVEPEAILEEMLKKKFLDISDPFELEEYAFWLMFYDQVDLMSLEVALVSEVASEHFNKELLTREPPTAGEKIVSPYDLIKSEAYAKMKIRLMSLIERKFMIKKMLEDYADFLKDDGISYSSDFRQDPDSYFLRIQDLIGRLNVNNNNGKQKPQIILDFRFFDERVKDFCDEKIVEKFLKFQTDSKKNKWLQKCLELGLPIFPNIPFSKLCFEIKNIL